MTWVILMSVFTRGNLMIDDRFSGHINIKSNPLPKEKTIDEWKQEANENPILQENHLIVVNKTRHTFFKVMAFFGVLLLLSLAILGFLFAGYIKDGINNGSFQPIVNQNINSKVNATVELSAPTTNNNNINPNINIYPNITINVAKLVTNSS